VTSPAEKADRTVTDSPAEMLKCKRKKNRDGWKEIQKGKTAGARR